MKLGLLLAVLAACGSSSNPQTDAAIPPDAKIFQDAAVPALTVKDYLAWCSVKVNNGAASTMTQVVMPAAGPIPLVATAANSTFKVGGNMWHHTDGDTGTGEPGTVSGTGINTMSTATVTFGTTAKCVWVCCPFQNGTGCDGLPDQCP
jgi:hypothetical protein